MISNNTLITLEDAERILMSMKQFLEVGDSQGAVMHVAGLVNLKANLDHTYFEEVLKKPALKPKRIKQKEPKPDKEAAKLAKAKAKAEEKAKKLEEKLEKEKKWKADYLAKTKKEAERVAKAKKEAE